MAKSPPTWVPKPVNGEMKIFLTKHYGKSGQLHVKNEIKTLPSTIPKNKLKMDQRPKCKTGHYKTLRGKHRKNTLMT